MLAYEYLEGQSGKKKKKKKKGKENSKNRKIITYHPLNPLTKTPLFAHFVAKSGPFGRLPGYGPDKKNVF